MKRTSIWKKLRKNEACMIAIIAIAFVVALYSVEYVTGLPASVRGTPVYGTLPTKTIQQSSSRSVPGTVRQNSKSSAHKRQIIRRMRRSSRTASSTSSAQASR